MEKKDLSSLDELETEINKLHDFLKSKRSSPYNYISNPLFRGQRSSEWELETTLERYLGRDVKVEAYNHYLKLIKPAIKSYTKIKWNDVTDTQNDDPFFFTPSNYEFMAYVRHHGFPSPLLDWTQSFYIALFFAFHKASRQERISLYAYVRYMGGIESGSGGEPTIIEYGPYVTTDKRHFMQQGQYTICVKKHDDSWVYYCHEDYFSNAKGEEDKNYLIKYTLPCAIKNDVLKKLQTMNINAFTLFGDEDSLMDMLAFKEIYGKQLT